MRIVYGYISKNGQILSENMDNFKVTKVATGTYDIYFKQDFKSLPAVVATQLWIESGIGNDTRDNVVLMELERDRARFITGNGDGNASDRDFTFIAMAEQ